MGFGRQNMYGAGQQQAMNNPLPAGQVTPPSGGNVAQTPMVQAQPVQGGGNNGMNALATLGASEKLGGILGKLGGGIMGSVGGSSGGSSGSSSGGGGGALGGALSGAGQGAMMGGSVFGPWGALIGGLGGGILGALGGGR